MNLKNLSCHFSFLVLFALAGCGGGGNAIPYKGINNDAQYFNIPSAVSLSKPYNLTSTTMNLSWTKNTDTSFASYRIYMSTSSGVTSASHLEGSISDKTTNTITIEELSPFTQYHFKVYVCDSHERCVESNEVSGITSREDQTTTFKFKGVKTCVGCHKKIDDSVTIWNDSKHAAAYETLSSSAAKQINDNAIQNFTCLKCHVTGIGQNGGFTIDADQKENDSVMNISCEACHGPGEQYSKLMMKAMSKKEVSPEEYEAAGLITPNENTCLNCHNAESPTWVELNYEQALKSISHGEKLPQSE